MLLLEKLPQPYFKTLLLLEFIALFLILPVSLYVVRHDVAPYLFYALFVILIWCLMLLVTDRRFKRFRFWNIPMMKHYLPNVLYLFAAAALGMLLATWWFAPEWLFKLPTEHTLLWLALLVLYPLLSAWPQELIFRTFMFHRYKQLFRSKYLRAWLSATSFALAHLIFANWIAVVGSFIAGLVFSYTYIQSRSTLLVAFEHSIWGCWLFTAGLGVHFDSSMIS
jgi:membrane protease YdiL (CAAX protease family)